jgi:phosphopantothenoylcysteine decarboxylase/phosphopantothenate--cysteine ligase
MRILVTAGPTREYIDSVRFITNASSGRMGYAIARAACQSGHDVTLLSGPVSLDPPTGVAVERFVSVSELRQGVERLFPACDALVMTAAVGDFTPQTPATGKLSRRDGPVTLTLVPTEDILAGAAAGKRADQCVVAFAVEDGPPAEIDVKARSELARKHADIVVLNTPAAMDKAESRATILSAAATLLPWAHRSKTDLAAEIVRLIEQINAAG